MASRAVHQPERPRHPIPVIQQYLATTYRRYGRGPVEFDCWGMVRDARVRLFGKPLLASYGAVGGQDPRGMTAAVNETIQARLKPSAPVPGSMAMGWRGRLCVHVGLIVEVDGRKWVLETNDGTGPKLTCLRDFERQFVKVTYYDD